MVNSSVKGATPEVVKKLSKNNLSIPSSDFNSKNLASAGLSESSVIKKNKKDALGRTYSTGRRKRSVARVWIKPGSGKVTVNKKNLESYFVRDTHSSIAVKPMTITKTSSQFDVMCTVKGGGCSGQAGAVSLGIARALDLCSPDLHSLLRQNGCLTRDSREVERKKYGKRKARKSTQFSKR